MPDVQEVFRMATQKVRPDPGALERQNRDQRRRTVTQRIGGYAVVAILAIAAVLIAVFAVGGEREERPAGQRKEEPSTAQLATEPHFLDLDSGETTLLPENLRGGYSYIASPDGTRVVYDPDEDACVGPQEALTIANIDGTGVRTIESPEEGSICGTQWSPDGTKLVYQERDPTGLDVGNLFVHDLASGQRTQVTDLELTKAAWYWLAPSFSEDGQNVLFHLPRDPSGPTKWDAWSVPVSGGEPTLVQRNASFPMELSTGHEGSQIAWLQPTLDLLTVSGIMTGRPIGHPQSSQTLVEANQSISWPSVSPDGRRIAYQDGVSTYVVEVETGEVSEATTYGEFAAWLDNDTLILSPGD